MAFRSEGSVLQVGLLYSALRIWVEANNQIVEARRSHKQLYTQLCLLCAVTDGDCTCEHVGMHNH